MNTIGASDFSVRTSGLQTSPIASRQSGASGFSDIIKQAFNVQPAADGFQNAKPPILSDISTIEISLLALLRNSLDTFSESISAMRSPSAFANQQNAAQSIQSFVTSFNDLLSLFSSLLGFDKDGRNVQNMMLSLKSDNSFISHPQSTFSLSDIGVYMNDNGKLILDKNALFSMSSDSIQAIMRYWIEPDGIADQLDHLLKMADESDKHHEELCYEAVDDLGQDGGEDSSEPHSRHRGKTKLRQKKRSWLRYLLWRLGFFCI